MSHFQFLEEPSGNITSKSGILKYKYRAEKLLYYLNLKYIPEYIGKKKAK